MFTHNDKIIPLTISNFIKSYDFSYYFMRYTPFNFQDGLPRNACDYSSPRCDVSAIQPSARFFKLIFGNVDHVVIIAISVTFQCDGTDREPMCQMATFDCQN